MSGSVVQSRALTGSTSIPAANISLAFSSDNTAGNNLWVVGHIGSNSFGFDPPTDTALNSYSATVDEVQDSTNDNRLGHWQVQSCAAGPNTVTVDCAGSNSAIYMAILIVEVAGVQNAAFNTHNGQHQTAPGTGTDAISSGTGASSAFTFLLGLTIRDNTGSASPPLSGTGFADGGSLWDFGDAGGARARFETKAAVAAGTVAATFTAAGSSDNVNTVMIALLETSASAPTINTQPTDQTALVGQPFTLTVSATTSGGALSYQWQDNSGGSFADIAGATSASLTLVATLQDMDRRHYRVNVTDSNGTTTSIAVTLRVVAFAPIPMPDSVGPWLPRDTMPARLVGPMTDVRSWLPVPLQVQKWFHDWLDVPAVTTGATTVNCTVGNLVLGAVAARVILTTTVRAGVGLLTLGAVGARVQLATAVNTTRGQLTLGGVKASVILTTVVRAGQGVLTLGGVRAGVNTVIGTRPATLTLGGVQARVILPTNVNASRGVLTLGSVSATITAQSVTNVNCGVGNLTLGGVRAVIGSTLKINAGQGVLTLGGVPAAVIQPTVVRAAVGLLQLGAVPASVAAQTTIGTHAGVLTLGGRAARVQIATAINTTPAVLTLGARQAQIRASTPTVIACTPGNLTLGGTQCGIGVVVPVPPPAAQPVGGGGGPGSYWQRPSRRSRMSVVLNDAVRDRVVLAVRATPIITPLATQIAAIVDAATDAAMAVQRAHWTPAHARVSMRDSAVDAVVAKVAASDPDLLAFFDLLMEEEA
jgi:hypothetical protein